MQLLDFDIIGISIRTTNERNQASKDIADLWKRFFSENICEKIPNKADPSIYSIYTDYEEDYKRSYTVILGCKVTNLDNVPQAMVGRTIPGGKFAKFTAKGNINEGAVFSEWFKIWNNPELDRNYAAADFEVYGEKAQNPEDAEVDIFICIK